MTLSDGDVRNVYLLGAGGHASVLLDLLLLLGIPLKGVVDRLMKTGDSWQGIPVTGDDETFLRTVAPEEAVLVNGLGANPDCGPRNRLYDLFKENGYTFLTLSHPSAVLSKRTVLQEGTAVMAVAVLQSGVSIGENVVVNTRAAIDHDCTIEKGAFISPGATLCGNVLVREGAFIGAGAVLLPGVEIGAWSVIGAGALVTRSVEAGVVAIGSPAKKIRDTGFLGGI